MIVPNPPRATVRLQFHAGFTLDDAVATVPYYAALGISHVYASPLLAARGGSTHGYDVTDPTRINPELGGLPALRRLVAALRAHGMGLVLDIVPNHMAASIENPWWRDVLEWGRDSRYAGYFDIDWAIPDPKLQGRVLVPTLGRPRDDLLEAGEVHLELEQADGAARIRVATNGQHFPLAAAAYAQVLGGVDALAGLARAFAGARHDASFDQARAALHERAQAPDGRAAIDAALARYASGTDHGRERLDELLADQPYLLAPWSQAWHRINWRRFFDVTDLVAIRPDRPEVFEATHAFVLQLYAQGLVDGLRIDHIDGLIGPGGYCVQLRERLAAVEGQRPADAPHGPAWLVVEKILAGDETLRRDWPVDGTTGYEFMAQVGALLHDPAGEAPLTHLWRELAGPADYDELALAARRQMATQNFAADLDATVRALQAVAEDSGTPVEPDTLRAALVEVVVHFPVYRTYADGGRTDAADAGVLARAAARAAGRTRDDALTDTIALLARWLSGDVPAAARAAAATAIARFQRLTPPVAAKAIEDTTFYRYGRLLSRNEVGAEPDRFALDVEDFHAACAQRHREWPHTLLATATHDHKRGEDARMRLAVLSECANEWAAQVHAWRELNAGHRSEVRGAPAPDAADEAILYQTLVGAWPPGLAPDDADGLRALAERVAEWQLKALREAKRHSGWAHPDEAYESACRRFLDACLSPGSAPEFLPGLAGFVERIGPTAALAGLTQALLRMTTPGLPDLYQGTDFWDFSLVDPDNRRPVDHAARAAALQAHVPLAELLLHWRDGRLKQRLVACALAARADAPALFADGGYRPLALRGVHAARAIAFAREHAEDAAVVVAPRLAWPLLGPDATSPRIEPECWMDTGVDLPAGEWREVLTGRVRRWGGFVGLGELLDVAPVGLLLRVG